MKFPFLNFKEFFIHNTWIFSYSHVKNSPLPPKWKTYWRLIGERQIWPLIFIYAISSATFVAVVVVISRNAIRNWKFFSLHDIEHIEFTQLSLFSSLIIRLKIPHICITLLGFRESAIKFNLIFFGKVWNSFATRQWEEKNCCFFCKIIDSFERLYEKCQLNL